MSCALKRIALMHGWGWDASIWRAVLPLLADLQLAVGELGYFGQPLNLPQGEFDLAVGHSHGAVWLMRHVRWRRLLAVNGFPTLGAQADLPAGVPQRVFVRMQQRFAEQPMNVLADFHAACKAITPPRGAANIPRLAARLKQLRTADERLLWQARAADIHLMAAHDDAIVPPALSAVCGAVLPPQQVRWVEHGGHLLPLTQPQLCADWVRALLV